ncbi:MAG: phytanoyl-CoA dioxygenase family protein [Kiloniellales bacterium]|nr:phytanoyl-CoA dioxygenase family protein [Kiloniellales bacterium]
MCAVNSLKRDGYAVIQDFLPQHQFETLLEEARCRLNSIVSTDPYPASNRKGFGHKISHSWGFDRFDSGTLNRFIALDSEQIPSAALFTRDVRLSVLSRAVVGKRHSVRGISLYVTINGDEERAPDLQKVLHRDTFFSSVKFWYFLTSVTEENGPFTYVPGSHLLTKKRLAWEKARSLEGSRARTRTPAQRSSGESLSLGGSFRVSPEELNELGLPAPQSITVPGNSLVFANTFGFHRRGDAKTGSHRLALYGAKRPTFPFSLLSS